MIGYIILSLVVLAFIIASYEDIKKREVYDYINYSLSFLVIISAIFHSMMISNIEPLKYVGFGILIGFALGSILYYLGIWGGGDAKFLIGFGGATYYLLGFTKQGDTMYTIYNYAINSFSYLIEIFLDVFLRYILIIDIIAILFIVISFLYARKKKDMKEKLNLFLILFLLFIGLYLSYSNAVLVIIGLVVFTLIFFGDDESFESIYFKIKKRIKNLEQGDKIDIDIKEEKEIIVKFEESRYGLTKENLNDIKEKKKNQDELINVRKVLPYSIIVVLNYLVYMLKIINLDDTNLEILGFLFKFLFYSFFAGAIIGISLLSIYYLKNFKKIKIDFKRYEIIGIFLFIIFVFGLYYITRIDFVFVLLSFIGVFLLLKIFKKVEAHMFIKEKEISKIVPGDWIAQDIKINNKIIYSEDDFKLGISEKQLENINKLSREYKNLKKIYVKDGLAFLPPLFIGFLIVILI